MDDGVPNPLRGVDVGAVARGRARGDSAAGGAAFGGAALRHPDYDFGHEDGGAGAPELASAVVPCPVGVEVDGGEADGDARDDVAGEVEFLADDVLDAALDAGELVLEVVG